MGGNSDVMLAMTAEVRSELRLLALQEMVSKAASRVAGKAVAREHSLREELEGGHSIQLGLFWGFRERIEPLIDSLPQVADRHALRGLLLTIDALMIDRSALISLVDLFARASLCREKSDSPNGRGYVYFAARDSVPDEIKIGFSRSPKSRIRGLNTGNAGRLQCLAKVPGLMTDEHALHRALRESRLNGEWFLLTREVSAALESAKAGDDIASIVDAADEAAE